MFNIPFTTLPNIHLLLTYLKMTAINPLVLLWALNGILIGQRYDMLIWIPILGFNFCIFVFWFFIYPWLFAMLLMLFYFDLLQNGQFHLISTQLQVRFAHKHFTGEYYFQRVSPPNTSKWNLSSLHDIFNQYVALRVCGLYC